MPGFVVHWMAGVPKGGDHARVWWRVRRRSRAFEHDMVVVEGGAAPEGADGRFSEGAEGFFEELPGGVGDREGFHPGGKFGGHVAGVGDAVAPRAVVQTGADDETAAAGCDTLCGGAEQRTSAICPSSLRSRMPKCAVVLA